MIDLVKLQQRFTALTTALDTMADDTPPLERAALRRQIVELYQEVDGVASGMVDLRDGIRQLGERYRRIVALAGGSEDAPRQLWADGADHGGAGRDATGGGGGAEIEMGRADDLDVSTYLDRAWNCLATCRYEDALNEVQRALERVPTSIQAETLRGWALMRMERLPEARGILEEVLRGSASAPLALASLGYVAYREGHYSEAIDHLSRASRDATDRKAVLYAHLYLGMLYTRREMFRDGRSFLSRALELGPSLVEAYWEMGRSYYLEGQFTLALDAWRRGAEVNRFDPWGERCQEAVDRAASGASVRLE